MQNKAHILKCMGMSEGKFPINFASQSREPFHECNQQLDKRIKRLDGKN